MGRPEPFAKFFKKATEVIWWTLLHQIVTAIIANVMIAIDSGRWVNIANILMATISFLNFGILFPFLVFLLPGIAVASLRISRWAKMWTLFAFLAMSTGLQIILNTPVWGVAIGTFLVAGCCIFLWVNNESFSRGMTKEGVDVGG